jgi:hypothetical protein
MATQKKKSKGSRPRDIWSQILEANKQQSEPL